jgi:hypothetical protein
MSVKNAIVLIKAQKRPKKMPDFEKAVSGWLPISLTARQLAVTVNEIY